MMRRLLTGLLLAAVAFSLAGCGGGDTGTAATSTATPSASTGGSAASPKAGSDNAASNASPVEVAKNEQFPTSKATVPAAILARLARKQPMLILYDDSTQMVSRDQNTEVDVVMDQYRGLIDLIIYDEATAVKSSETTKNAELQKAIELTTDLGVKHAPYMLFVDRYGRITGRFAGFVDRKLIELEVLRATQ